MCGLKFACLCAVVVVATVVVITTVPIVGRSTTYEHYLSHQISGASVSTAEKVKGYVYLSNQVSLFRKIVI